MLSDLFQDHTLQQCQVILALVELRGFSSGLSSAAIVVMLHRGVGKSEHFVQLLLAMQTKRPLAFPASVGGRPLRVSRQHLVQLQVHELEADQPLC